jgi:hypothetical protein
VKVIAWLERRSKKTKLVPHCACLCDGAQAASLEGTGPRIRAPIETDVVERRLGGPRRPRGLARRTPVGWDGHAKRVRLGRTKVSPVSSN